MLLVDVPAGMDSKASAMELAEDARKTKASKNGLQDRAIADLLVMESLAAGEVVFCVCFSKRLQARLVLDHETSNQYVTRADSVKVSIVNLSVNCAA